MRFTLLSLIGAAAVLFAVSASAQVTLYAGNGWDGTSANPGALLTINQATGAGTLVGTPAGVARITGLGFASPDVLYASTQDAGFFPPPPRFSHLIQVNPDTGALVADIGQITNSATGAAVSVADLAVQPGTGVLFGVQTPLGGPGGGNLLTINPATAQATVVGNPGLGLFGTIAFAPNGTLYYAARDFDIPTTTLISVTWATVNPATGAAITTVPTDNFYGALAVRPTDGVIFGGVGDDRIFTINPVTGAGTVIGVTGAGFPGDLAFRVPEPGSLAFAAALIPAALAAFRRRKA